jgi:hypothetical protein
MIFSRFAMVCFFTLSAFARAQDPADVEALKKGQPKDVAAFIHRSFNCHHWAGEEPYDKARAQEIARAIKRYHCDRMEADEARLRKKYRNTPKVLEVLDAAKKV